MSSLRLLLLSILLLGALAGAQSASAAVIKVPNDWDTITSAVAAALPGDTVEITNSSTYIEALSITKPITLMATLGQSPVIQGIGGTSAVVVSVASTGAGAQIGSNAGGRIELKCGPSYTGNDYILVRTNHTGATPVICENLFLNTLNTNAQAARVYGIYPRQDGAAIYRNILIDGGNVSSTAIRLHYLTLATTELDHVRVRNTASNAVVITNSSPTLVVKFCELGATAAGIRIYSNSGTADKVKLEVDRSLLLSDTDGAAGLGSLVIRGVNSQVDVTRSLLRSNSGHGVRIWSAANGVRLTMDHCDIVNTAGSLPAFLVETGTNRNVSITNSNIQSINSGGFSVTTDASSTFVSNFNNVHTPAGTAYTGITAGANDVQPGQNPQYVSLATGNILYNNTFLKTAGQHGSSIGVNQNYSDILTFVPVSRAAHWSFY